ncbi:hypothetical protein [Streptomyces sp. NK15101]|nr:hypothetical protein [Streptomyces sp. NK15101]
MCSSRYVTRRRQPNRYLPDLDIGPPGPADLAAYDVHDAKAFGRCRLH